MSTIKVDTIQNTSGTDVYTAKVWVNFNGTGTVAIRNDGNLSSITDNGVGIYTCNFTTAMSDANYNVTSGSHYSATAARGSVWAESYASTTSSCVVVTSAYNALYDCASVTVSVIS